MPACGAVDTSALAHTFTHTHARTHIHTRKYTCTCTYTRSVGHATELTDLTPHGSGLPDNFLTFDGGGKRNQQQEVDGRVFDSEMNRNFLTI